MGNTIPGVWLTLQEAANHVRLSRTTLERLIREGCGPRVFRSGRRKLVFSIADLDRWLRGEEERP